VWELVGLVALTEVEKIRRLPWLIVGDFFNIIFCYLTFAGPVFILFLDELGMDSAQIGLVLSLIPFCGIVALFIAPLVTRLGYKRVFIIFWIIRKFVISLLLLTPLVLARFGRGATFLWVVAVLFAFAMCRAIAETGVYPWQQEVVPDSIRGKVSAVSSIGTTLGTIMATTAAGLVLGSDAPLGRFVGLMAVGIAIGLLGVAAFSQVPAESPRRTEGRTVGHVRGMQEALANRNFLFFLAALGLATLGSLSVISFIPLFMKTQVGLSERMVVLLSIGTQAGALLTSFLWGWLADRYGSKPLMQFSLGLMMLLPVAWFAMPRQSPTNATWAMLIAFVSGVATLGWQISWMRYLFISALPREGKPSYVALYYAWLGLTSGGAPLLAGQILSLARGVQTRLGVVTIDPYTPLFVLSLVALAGGIVAVSPLRSDKPTTLRHLTRILWSGNPLKALVLLIRYRLAGTEVARAAVTQSLGQTQNPLSARELIEALSDPSFNVRYEAVHAIGRMPPEPELVDALLGILQDDESDLSGLAARSLGKLGDRQAIPPLRRAALSKYPYLAANSVRALATLGDVESIPCFLERLRSEPGSMLRVAYASALGKLVARQAVDDLLAMLREVDGEVTRGEVGLALARLAGDERYYLQHWRALRSGRDTAAAQALLGLQKSARHARRDGLAGRLEACAQCFAQGDAAQGAAQLRESVDTLPGKEIDEALAAILRGCVEGLDEFGADRSEYILLALHALDIALRSGIGGSRIRD
jgi:HEAT repeat protein/Na+/melibiose symporter-like transporter